MVRKTAYNVLAVIGRRILFIVIKCDVEIYRNVSVVVMNDKGNII